MTIKLLSGDGVSYQWLKRIRTQAHCYEFIEENTDEKGRQDECFLAIVSTGSDMDATQHTLY